MWEAHHRRGGLLLEEALASGVRDLCGVQQADLERATSREERQARVPHMRRRRGAERRQRAGARRRRMTRACAAHAHAHNKTHDGTHVTANKDNHTPACGRMYI
ncbi:uncharacterized protein ACA1_377730 [Acanthamoeba castellanii str. Neff]|uniref:Uncharacterized protein n=1 Tax=Acanthamoeba castellanii (strain ATCC 30010 / Neff) TaxID=1257118 RepID=L8GSU4_ACACF|nr:uncharacterized protein ACA1_377730 [Acanthamoeba castellanii str. Neff]ELR15658.1 hypothetical protein ACA1_377730 [Acanthamoeba castellanii str. Neff]